MDISHHEYKLKIAEQKAKLESSQSQENILKTANYSIDRMRAWLKKKQNPDLRKVINDIIALLKRDPATGLAIMDVMAQEIFPEYLAG